MKKVQVPGVGTLTFPDEMSDADMHNAIQKNYPNLNGNVQQKTPQGNTKESSLLDTIANNPITDTIIGMGDAPNNFVRQTDNFIAPKSMQVPMAKNSSGLAYEGGNFLGDLATFGAAGAGLNTARKAAQAIPVAGEIARYLGGTGVAGAARRAIGAGAYGAIETPEHRTRGALEGAALSGGLDAITGGVSKILPKRYMSQLYQGITDGLIAAKSESGKMYNKVIKPFGGQPISLIGIKPEIFEGDSKLKSYWGKFQKNPSISNAHKLQSQIGSAERGIVGIDIFSKERKNALKDSRENILNSIRKSLGSKYPQAKEAYEAATNNHRKTVVPYEMTNTRIRNIVDPTPEKVARELDKVTKLKGYPKNRESEIDIPLTPKHISKLGEELSSRIRNRNVAKTVGGFFLGGQVGSAIGSKVLGEVMGAYMGAKSADPFKKINSGVKKMGKESALQRMYSNIVGGGSLPKDLIKTEALRDESPILNMFLSPNKSRYSIDKKR